MHFILFCAVFLLLLPFEMYVWGSAFDQLLQDSYLAKRIQLSMFFGIPSWLLLFIGVCALFCIVYAFWNLYRKSHKYDFMLLYCVPLLVALMLLYTKLPCAAAVGIPLFSFGVMTAWFTKPLKERQTFSVSKDLHRTPLLSERCRALFLIFAIQCGGCLLFQQGFNLWFSSGIYLLLLLFPFLGCLLKSTGKIRKYLTDSFMALLLCGILYWTGLVITNQSCVLDLSIIFAYLFFELEFMIFLRRFFPETRELSACSGKNLIYYFFRNISIFIFAVCIWMTKYIMPPVCPSWVVPLGAYILFILIENSETVYRKLFCRSRSVHRTANLFSQVEYTAQGWGLGAVLAAWLAGPNRIMYIFAFTGAMLAGSLIRTKYLSNRKENHIILRNFPYLIEIVLILALILICGGSKETTVIMICICACASCLMLMIRSAGAIPGKYGDSCFASNIFQTLSYGGTCFLLWALFFFRVPASLLFGIYFILSGFIRIGEASYLGTQGRKRLTAGWCLVIAGQIITVIPSAIRLPAPQWSSNAVICGLIAFAALYFFRTIDFRNRNNRKIIYEKEN